MLFYFYFRGLNKQGYQCEREYKIPKEKKDFLSIFYKR